MAYTYSAKLGVGVTGLTMKGSLVDSSGTLHASLKNIACPEVSTSGDYLFLSAAIPDSYRGDVIFHTGTLTTISDLTTVNNYGNAGLSPQETENTDAKTSSVGGGGLTAAQTRAALGMSAADLDDQLDAIAARTILISAGGFSIVSPVNSDGTEITLFRGDDYFNADARALIFTSADFPVLTGLTVKLKVAGIDDITGAVTSATSVYFEIARATTATMGGGDFEVEATLADGHVSTIATGTITMSGQL